MIIEHLEDGILQVSSNIKALIMYAVLVLTKIGILDFFKFFENILFLSKLKYLYIVFFFSYYYLYEVFYFILLICP